MAPSASGPNTERPLRQLNMSQTRSQWVTLTTFTQKTRQFQKLSLIDHRLSLAASRHAHSCAEVYWKTRPRWSSTRGNASKLQLRPDPVPIYVSELEHHVWTHVSIFCLASSTLFSTESYSSLSFNRSKVHSASWSPWGLLPSTYDRPHAPRNSPADRTPALKETITPFIFRQTRPCARHCVCTYARMRLAAPKTPWRQIFSVCRLTYNLRNTIIGRNAPGQSFPPA